jgi:hypothetical protein
VEEAVFFVRDRHGRPEAGLGGEDADERDVLEVMATVQGIGLHLQAELQVAHVVEVIGGRALPDGERLEASAGKGGHREAKQPGSKRRCTLARSTSSRSTG